jgi:hypothetical protein
MQEPWEVPDSTQARRIICGTALTPLVLLTVGFHVAGQTVVFGILTHLIPVVIAFILFIIGASSLTALTDKIDCNTAGDAFDRCNIVKGLVIISWIDT